MSHSFRDLVAWQKSMVLVKQVYKATANYPRANSTASLIRSDERQFRSHAILQRDRAELLLGISIVFSGMLEALFWRCKLYLRSLHHSTSLIRKKSRH